MLEKIREGSQGIVAKAILGLVILTFALSGVYSYLGSSSTPAAATVNGEEISQQEFQRVYENERARMEAQMGEFFSQLASSPEYLNNFKDGVLDRLIADQLTLQAADGFDMRVGDAEIKDAIRTMPEFQVEGAFNNERYLALLRQAGFTPNGFRDYLRAEMTRRQLTRAIVMSEFALDSEAVAFNKLNNQTRDVKYVSVDSEAFKSQVAVTDEQIKAYYDSNLAEFDTQEQVALEYVQLNSADMASAAEVSDADVESYYQDNKASYSQAEKRRASHILIELGDDEAAAKAKTEALLAEIKAGKDFAELAKANSADTFSAENGGDLDWFEAGVMDPAFDEATFALANVGDVSDVVQSAFGFHIIKLTDIDAEKIKPLDEVKADIQAQLKLQKASEAFYEKSQRLSELAFEFPDSLADSAEELGLEIVKTDLFDRTSIPAFMNNPLVADQAFSSELINDQINSDVIELADENVIVIRVAEHKPVRTQSLDEVKEQVIAKLEAQEAANMAQAVADELLVAVNDKADVAALLTEKQLSWIEKAAVTRTSAELDRLLVTEVFKLAKPQAESVSAAVVKTATGYALVEVTSVKEGEEGAPTERDSVKQRLAAGESQRLLQQFVEALKATAKIEKNAV